MAVEEYYILFRINSGPILILQDLHKHATLKIEKRRGKLYIIDDGINDKRSKQTK